MLGLSNPDKVTLTEAIKLLAEHGRLAAEVIRDAVVDGELEDWQLDEAVAQLEDLSL